MGRETMGAAPLRTRLIVLSILAAMAFAACAPAAPASRPPDAAGVGGGTQEQPGRKKVLTMGLNAILDAFSIAGSTVTAGGRLSFIEIHSQALFTADKTSGRPILTTTDPNPRGSVRSSASSACVTDPRLT